jgi:hypothetical protein
MPVLIAVANCTLIAWRHSHTASQAADTSADMAGLGLSSEVVISPASSSSIMRGRSQPLAMHGCTQQQQAVAELDAVANEERNGDLHAVHGGRC